MTKKTVANKTVKKAAIKTQIRRIVSLLLARPKAMPPCYR